MFACDITISQQRKLLYLHVNKNVEKKSISVEYFLVEISWWFGPNEKSKITSVSLPFRVHLFNEFLCTLRLFN